MPARSATSMIISPGDAWQTRDQGALPTEVSQGEHSVVPQVGRLAQEVRDGAGGPVDSLGVAVPGLYIPETGVVTFLTNVPGDWSASDILKLNPDGVFLSKGPGDPEPVEYAHRAIADMLGKLPIFGICLGHQLLALACGAKTFKLKFGHRGANQPVLDIATGRVEITSQNHGFAVEEDSLPDCLEITHRNLNDDTIAGVRHRELDAFSVQYHPEAAAGPHDSHYLFETFQAKLNAAAV